MPLGPRLHTPRGEPREWDEMGRPIKSPGDRPIEIQRGNEIIEFPAGTPDEEIVVAMRRLDAVDAARQRINARGAGNSEVREWDEHGRPIQSSGLGSDYTLEQVEAEIQRRNGGGARTEQPAQEPREWDEWGRPVPNSGASALRVRGTDGVIIEFPAGTDRRTINSVMAQRHAEFEARGRAGNQQAGATAPPQRPQRQNVARPTPPFWSNVSREEVGPYVSRDQAEGRSIRGLVGGGAQREQMSEQRERYLMRNYTNFGGGVESISQGATLGFGDEAAGALNGFGAAVDEAFRPGPNLFGRMSRRARGAYEDTVDTSRLFVERARREAPVASFVNEVGGGLFTGGAVGGSRRTAVTAAERGLPGFARQTARASATGGAYGAAYGYGTGTGDFEQRSENAREGATYGAAFGAAAPAAVNTLRGSIDVTRPAWSRVARMAEPTMDRVANWGRSAMAPDTNAVGAFGLPSRRPPPRPTPPPRRPPAVGPAESRRLATLADRAGVTSDEFAATASAARTEPGGQVLADAFGDAGIRQLRPMVQAPGRTGAAAARAADERFSAAPSRIAGALRDRLQVSESRAAAVQRLEDDYRRISAEGYNPLWDQPFTPQQHALYEQRILPLLSDENPNQELRRVMRQAMRRAMGQFDLDAANGLVTGRIGDNVPRFLHYLRGEIGELARFEASPLRGASGRRLGSLRELYRRFGELIDPSDGGAAIVPGYRRVTGQWGDTYSAMEALDAGAGFLKQAPHEVQRAIARMSPFEQMHARIGLADEVRRMTRGQVVGNRNVANALNDPDMQGAIAAAFDSPEQAAAFLNVLNTQNRLMRNASAWGAGSQTQGNMAYEADGMMAAAADVAGSALTGRFGQAMNSAGRKFGNAVTAGAIERGNNRYGEVLLRRIDDESARSFTDEVVRILRNQESARQRAATASRVAGAGAGVAQGQE